jgi:hypothetical protein
MGHPEPAATREAPPLHLGEVGGLARAALERDEEKWTPVFRPHPALIY